MNPMVARAAACAGQASGERDPGSAALWHIEEDALEAIEASGVAVGDYGEVVRHEFGGLVNQGHTIEFGVGDDAQDVL
jgi:hypothetical protein